MSELAFNLNGEAFAVPPEATGWRVRRMRAKGAPEVVYAREGQPLVLPIGAEIDDLRAEVDVAGRYRLDLVDQTNKAIENAQPGYVQVNLDAPTTASPASSASRAAFGTPTDNIVLEAMRMQSTLTASVIDRFNQMMEAAATLLRAADGAGLPARPPMAIEKATEDEDDSEEDTTEPGEQAPAFDLNALITQAVSVVLTGLSNGTLKIPDLGSMLDWRKAARKAKALSDGASAGPNESAASTGEVDVAPPPIDPAVMAHVFAVRKALEPHEAAYVQEVAAELKPDELRGWLGELSKLSVPDAVARVRSLIAGKKGPQ
jgi:hypothetical protein